MKPILSAKEAAVALGCSPQKVRERLKLNIWTFGQFIPKEKTGHLNNSYDIISKELAEHLHITDEELEELLKRGRQKK